MANDLSLTKIGTYAGSITAILALLWYIGELALDSYVDGHIKAYEEAKKIEDSSKAKLRHLLGDKMEIADDEVHIEIGRMYKKVKTEANFDFRIDSLSSEVKLNFYEIGINIKAIEKLQDDIKILTK